MTLAFPQIFHSVTIVKPRVRQRLMKGHCRRKYQQSKCSVYFIARTLAYPPAFPLNAPLQSRLFHPLPTVGKMIYRIRQIYAFSVVYSLKYIFRTCIDRISKSASQFNFKTSNKTLALQFSAFAH